MQDMKPDEWRAFLTAGTRTAKLATVRADGRPHVAPVWFVLDGDSLVFMTAATTVKGRNLRRDPRVSLTVDDEAFPYAFVLVEGEATLQEPTPRALLPWATKIARRYVDPKRAEIYGRRNAVEGELLVRVPLTRVVAKRGVAD